MNGDGYSDIIIGVEYADPYSVNMAETSYMWSLGIVKLLILMI